MMVPLLCFFSLALLCVNSQTPPPNAIYAETDDGAEVIHFGSPVTISYASNLQMDNNNTALPHTLYFTAGRRQSNLYTAQFYSNIDVEDPKFWATGVPLPTSAGPFLSYSVLRNNIIGPAFPKVSNIASFVVQSVYLGSQPSVYEYITPGLNILSALISPIPESTGTHYVYLAGWDNNTNSNFVVARATIIPDQPNPSFQLNLETDVWTTQISPPCYDEFDEVVHPQIYLVNNQLIVLIPKRCSTFYKITIPQQPTPFNEAQSVSYYPPKDFSNEIYVSSAIFDPLYSITYFTTKAYNIPGAKLFSFNTASWTPNSYFLPLDLIEAETLLVLGSDMVGTQVDRYIFVIASGANKVQRLKITNNTFSVLAEAALTPSYNLISSAWYYRPALYFTTYEPDSKVGRIPKANFCADWCGDYGYCTNGYCKCREGYTFDDTDPANLCVPEDVYDEEEKEKETQSSAAALGVLFAFSLLAAIVGWVMWWRSRQLRRLPGSY